MLKILDIASRTREILRLPIDQRVQFLVAGPDSLSDADSEIEQAWIVESVKRDAEIESSVLAVRPLEEAVREIFRR
jgi:hypothetical protein